MDAHDDELRRTEATREAGDNLDAFNAELSGIASGRMSRFLPADHESKSGAQERRAEKDRAQMNALESLLATDPAYAALYHETFNRLREAEDATEAALLAAQEALTQASDTLRDIQGQATVLQQDGRRVYRAADGTACDENGAWIEGEALESLVWRDGAPSYEELLAARQARIEQEERIKTLHRYQAEVLGHARNRLTDKVNPPNAEEVQDIQNSIKQQMPSHAQQHLPVTHESPAVERTATIKPLDLGG